jgi:dihydroxyacetone kinase-like protein
VTAAVDVEGLERWLRETAQSVSAERDRLTALDAAIGDGDHGTNLDRGFTAVLARLDEQAGRWRSAGDLLQAVGMTLVSTVGGASGPLYGTFFLRMAASAGAAAEAELDGAAFARALRAGADGVVARGKAQAGDKTMYDALEPACCALEAALSRGAGLGEALAGAALAADEGRDATLPMLARKGRASYLGERSIGHVDPGATSAALLVEAAAAALLGPG